MEVLSAHFGSSQKNPKKNKFLCFFLNTFCNILSLLQHGRKLCIVILHQVFLKSWFLKPLIPMKKKPFCFEIIVRKVHLLRSQLWVISQKNLYKVFQDILQPFGGGERINSSDTLSKYSWAEVWLVAAYVPCIMRLLFYLMYIKIKLPGF